MSADKTVESLPPAPLREAVAALRRLRKVPGPENFLKLFNAPGFDCLRGACKQLYPEAFDTDEKSCWMDSHLATLFMHWDCLAALARLIATWRSQTA